jgi:hypothetical protein
LCNNNELESKLQRIRDVPAKSGSHILNMSAQQAQEVLGVPALVEQIAAASSANDVAVGLRGLSPLTRAVLGPEHATVRLSQRVPNTTFAEKWAAPGAMHSISYDDRIQLLALTAASGDIDNLRVALEAVRCAPTVKVR